MNWLAIAPWLLSLLVGGIGFTAFEIERSNYHDAQAALVEYKAKEATNAMAQAVSIMKEAATQAEVHLSNARNIMAAADVGTKEIRNVVVQSGCEKDALSDATASAVQRVWQSRGARAGPPAADRPGAAGAVPGPAASGGGRTPPR